jgi:hypothetical protein
MKRLFLILPFLLLLFPAFSQKIPVTVVTHNRTGFTGWQILDENYGIVFSGEYIKEDSITISLETEKRYFFYFSLQEELPPDTKLYSVILDTEPLLLVTSSLGTGDHFLPFFTGVKQPEAKITGGEDALITEFPWQIYLTTDMMSCGGSIISPEWILTAAHCVTDDNGNTLPASQFIIRAGLNNPYNLNDGESYRAAQVIPHEQYNTRTLENDIALIRLTTPINTRNAAPIKMITTEDVKYGATDPGVMSWITGWGLTQLNPNVFPRSLQKVQIPIVSNQQASVVWRSIPSTVLMAGYLDGNKDACNGDSGGPLVVSVLGEYKLAGLVSWGSPECDTYGAYTRVSLFGNWISSRTGISPLFSPPAPTGDTLVCRGTSSTRYTVPSVPGLQSYEWRIQPENAGTISSTSTSATISWRSDFTGVVQLGFRVTRDGVVSDWSRLSIRVVPATRFITQQADTSVCEGELLVLRMQAEGYNLVYRWYRNNILVQSGPLNRYVMSSANPLQSGVYRVEIQSYCGNITSRNINIAILPLTRVRSVSPDRNISPGSSTTLEVTSEGHNLTWQWLKDNVPLPGETGPALAIDDADATDIGVYKAVVSGTCGTVTSDSIYVFVSGGDLSGGQNLLVWPTVTEDVINVATGNDKLYNVRIYNTTGKLLRSYDRLRYQTEISLAVLPKGLYLVVVYNEDFRKTVKVVKN